MKSLFKFLGSLSFAILLLGAMVAVLTVSTLTESKYGTPLAQQLFYNARWFDIFLGLFAVNILFSALSRWPYRLHHTGFLITHLGILLLLTGCLMNRVAGVEGQMALMENEEKDYMLQQDYDLTVHTADGKHQRWALKRLSSSGKSVLPLDGGRLQLKVERIEEGVYLEPEVKEGDPSAPVNRAVRFTLQSQIAHLDEPFWLVEHGGQPSFSDQMTVGMAHLALKEGRAGAPAQALAAIEPRLRLVRGGGEAVIPLRPGKTPDAPQAEMGLTVTDITYFPDARVDENNKLVNASDTPRNPAVKFTLDDGHGQKEERVIFTLFPDFESIHGRKSGSFSDIKVELLAPKSELAGPGAGGAGLTFYFDGNGWSYEARSKKGTVTGEPVKGRTEATGWMDFTFRVDETYDRAVIGKKVSFSGSPKKGDTGALLSLTENGKTVGSGWALPDQPVHFETSTGVVVGEVGASSFELPFRLQLIDFRKKDYPGTENAASYESDVRLQDPTERVTIQKTIWMNHPLDYKGFRIFQSSFIQDPEAGETSIFTIAKNPGIVLIYGGSIIMFLGVVCVFYVKPFSYFSARSSSHASKK